MFYGEIVMTEPAWSLCAGDIGVTCLDFNQDGSKICFSNELATCCILSTKTGACLATMKQRLTQVEIVGMRFIPGVENILVGASRDGYLMAYDTEAGAVVASQKNLGSNISCLAMDPFGDGFAFGCADGSLRIHDIETLARTGVLLRTSSKSATGQTSGVFDVAYHPVDTNIIVSAASDRVYIWDVRTGSSERALVGTHVRGPGIDIYEKTIYTASQRDSRQLEAWDLGTATRIKDITGTRKLGPLVSAAVGKNGLVCAVGGSDGITTAFDLLHEAEMGSSESVGSPIVHVAVAPQSEMIVYGTERGQLYCRMVRKKPFYED